MELWLELVLYLTGAGSLLISVTNGKGSVMWSIFLTPMNKIKFLSWPCQSSGLNPWKAWLAEEKTPIIWSLERLLLWSDLSMPYRRTLSAVIFAQPPSQKDIFKFINSANNSGGDCKSVQIFTNLIFCTAHIWEVYLILSVNISVIYKKTFFDQHKPAR